MNAKAEVFQQYLKEKDITVFKSFKYYTDDEGNLILNMCILCRDGEADGDMIYTMFDVLITHLQDAYKYIMKVIWQ